MSIAIALYVKNFVRKYTPPSDRFAEILCGLIMVLTFTLAGGIAKADAKEIILGAAGCAIAWGIIDGTILLLNTLFQRGRRMKLIERAQGVSHSEAVDMLRREFDEQYAEVISSPTRELVYQDITNNIATTPIKRPTITKNDIMGAIGLVTIESICSLFAIVPLLILGNEWYALRVSNITLLVVMAMVAFHWAGWAGWTGVGRVLISAAICSMGILMVVVAILMGG